LQLPLPRLAGAHQIDNAGLAIAMLRAQDVVPVNDGALRAGMGWAEWPARLQRLDVGPLTALLPADAEVWIDGGHNPAAGKAIAAHFNGAMLAERPFYVVAGMLATKDAGGFLRAFVPRATAIYAVPVERHAGHAPDDLVRIAREAGVPGQASPNVASALTEIARHADRTRPPVVLVTGSLYLAGDTLSENGQSAG
jgi:dihydrofolate synthase/folylpolyglutamate synthase